MWLLSWWWWLPGAGADTLGGVPSTVSWQLELNLTAAYPGWSGEFASVPLLSNNHCRQWNGTGRISALWWCSPNPRALYGDNCPVPKTTLEAYTLLCSPLDLRQVQHDAGSLLGLRLGPAGGRTAAWLWSEEDVTVYWDEAVDPGRLGRLFDDAPETLLALPSWAIAAVTQETVTDTTFYKWQAVVCGPETTPLSAAAGFPVWRYCCRVVGNLRDASTVRAWYEDVCADVPRRLLTPGADPQPAEPCGPDQTAVLCRQTRLAWNKAQPVPARRCTVFCRWPCRGELPASVACDNSSAWQEPRTGCTDSGQLRLRACDRSLLSEVHTPCRSGELALASPPGCAAEPDPEACAAEPEFCAAGRVGCTFFGCRCWAGAGGAAGCCGAHPFCSGHGRLCERKGTDLGEQPYAVCQCDDGYVGERCEERLPELECHLSARTRALHAHPVDVKPSPSRTPSRTPTISGTPSRTPSCTSSRTPTISGSPSTTVITTPGTTPSRFPSLAPAYLFRHSSYLNLCLCAATFTWELCPSNTRAARSCAMGYDRGRLLGPADPTGYYLQQCLQLSVPRCVLSGFAWVDCASSPPVETGRYIDWIDGRLSLPCYQCDENLHCVNTILYLQAPSSAGARWVLGQGYSNLASLTTSIPWLFQTDTPTASASVSVSPTRSATASASTSGSLTASRTISLSPSPRKPAVIVRGGGGDCLRPGTASWGDCGTLTEQLDLAVTLYNNRLQWPSYGSGRFAYALAAASAVGCDLPPPAFGQSFALALSPLDPYDGLQQVAAVEARPGAFWLRLTGCGLNHTLRPRGGWVPANACGEECLVTLTALGLSPTPSGSASRTPTSSATRTPTSSGSRTPSRSPAPPFVMLDGLGYCLSLSSDTLSFRECAGGAQPGASEIWYHVENFVAGFPDCWTTRGNADRCLSCLHCDRYNPARINPVVALSNPDGVSCDNYYIVQKAALTLDQGRLRLDLCLAGSFSWLQRDLTWVANSSNAQRFTILDFPTAGIATTSPRQAVPPVIWPAMYKRAELDHCLKVSTEPSRSVPRPEVSLQACPSLAASAAVKAPYQFISGGFDGLFWSANNSFYLQYQVVPSTGFCSTEDPAYLALELYERLSPLSLRIFIDGTGVLRCGGSPGYQYAERTSVYQTGPYRFVPAGTSDYWVIPAWPYDVSATPTRSITASVSITASRTPSVSVTPRPLAYETTQGYVNLVVSRPLAGGEELLWLGPAGRVATTLASNQLDPRGGLDLASRQAQWCSVSSDADRLRYAVVFANYPTSSNKWYGNGTGISTTAANSSSEWFELVQVAAAGSRNVSAAFGGPLYQLAIANACVGVGGSTAEVAMLPCGSSGTELYLLTQNPTPSATPTISITPSLTPTASASSSRTPTASASSSRTASVSLTSSMTRTISLTPSITATSSNSPKNPVVRLVTPNGNCLTMVQEGSVLGLQSCVCGSLLSELNINFIINYGSLPQPIYWAADTSYCVNWDGYLGKPTLNLKTTGCSLLYSGSNIQLQGMYFLQEIWYPGLTCLNLQTSSQQATSFSQAAAVITATASLSSSISITPSSSTSITSSTTGSTSITSSRTASPSRSCTGRALSVLVIIGANNPKTTATITKSTTSPKVWNCPTTADKTNFVDPWPGAGFNTYPDTYSVVTAADHTYVQVTRTDCAGCGWAMDLRFYCQEWPC